MGTGIICLPARLGQRQDISRCDTREGNYVEAVALPCDQSERKLRQVNAKACSAAFLPSADCLRTAIYRACSVVYLALIQVGTE